MAREREDMTKLVAAIGAAAVAALILAYLIYRDYREINQAKMEIERYERSIEADKAKIKQIPALREQRYRLTHAVEEYVRILPDRREVEALYDTLSDFEQKSGIDIQQFSAPPVTRGKAAKTSANFIKQTRDVRIAGRLFEVASFINLIESYKRFMRVDSFNMTPIGAGLGGLTVTLKMSTFTYQRGTK